MKRIIYGLLIISALTFTQQSVIAMEAPAPQDYYQVLGITRDADETQVKRAYRKLALILHPDKLIINPEYTHLTSAELQEQYIEEKTALFKQASKAYAVLSDAALKARYDAGEVIDEHHGVEMPDLSTPAGRDTFLRTTLGEDFFADLARSQPVTVRDLCQAFRPTKPDDLCTHVNALFGQHLEHPDIESLASIFATEEVAEDPETLLHLWTVTQDTLAGEDLDSALALVTYYKAFAQRLQTMLETITTNVIHDHAEAFAHKAQNTTVPERERVADAQQLMVQFGNGTSLIALFTDFLRALATQIPSLTAQIQETIRNLERCYNEQIRETVGDTHLEGEPAATPGTHRSQARATTPATPRAPRTGRQTAAHIIYRAGVWALAASASVAMDLALASNPLTAEELKAVAIISLIETTPAIWDCKWAVPSFVFDSVGGAWVSLAYAGTYLCGKTISTIRSCKKTKKE